MKIKLEINGEKIFTTSPYNESFVNKARNLKGTWNGGKWVFSATMLDHVRKAMIEHYGVTGETDYPTCTLVVKDFNDVAWGKGIELFGLPICKAYGRDSGAKLADDIFLIEGSINSGGSAKNWKTTISNATIEIHNFPVAALNMPAVQTAISEQRVEVKGIPIQQQEKVYFDAFEVHPVIEITTEDGQTFCEQCDDDPEKATYWSLFGHLSTGGLQCIGDYKSEAEANEMMERILLYKPFH